MCATPVQLYESHAFLTVYCVHCQKVLSFSKYYLQAACDSYYVVSSKKIGVLQKHRKVLL